MSSLGLVRQRRVVLKRRAEQCEMNEMAKEKVRSVDYGQDDNNERKTLNETTLKGIKNVLITQFDATEFADAGFRKKGDVHD